MAITAADRIKANAERLRKAPMQQTVTPERPEQVPQETPPQSTPRSAPAPVVRQKDRPPHRRPVTDRPSRP